MANDTVFETRLPGLQRIHQGKVRDVYALDDRHLLIVATDRLSAFDVVLPDPIPGKGRVLTQISNFWFARTRHIVPNHLTDYSLDAYLHDPAERAMLEGRSVIVKRLKALPVEAVVRGYLIGSGWKDYQRSGSICGIGLPPGLQQADRLPEPIFTPATKAAIGDHDENVDFAHVAEVVGASSAAMLRDTSLAVYSRADDIARERGIVLADTKFEFGHRVGDDRLILADEVLTPDSSRFWPLDQWRPGRPQPSFDKQYVRDWLTSPESGWDRGSGEPPPPLPDEVVERTRAKYAEAFRMLTGSEFGPADRG
jgi:phosphoribosylaminoimidazole-succinocarboxamide synthase